MRMFSTKDVDTGIRAVDDATQRVEKQAHQGEECHLQTGGWGENHVCTPFLSQLLMLGDISPFIGQASSISNYLAFWPFPLCHTLWPLTLHAM